MRTLALALFLAPAFADAGASDWFERRSKHAKHKHVKHAALANPKSRKSRQAAPFQLARKWSGSGFLDGSWAYFDAADARRSSVRVV